MSHMSWNNNTKKRKKRNHLRAFSQLAQILHIYPWSILDSFAGGCRHHRSHHRHRRFFPIPQNDCVILQVTLANPEDNRVLRTSSRRPRKVETVRYSWHLSIQRYSKMSTPKTFSYMYSSTVSAHTSSNQKVFLEDRVDFKQRHTGWRTRRRKDSLGSSEQETRELTFSVSSIGGSEI